jgi:DNA-binding CsgD family transcriptional regulator
MQTLGAVSGLIDRIYEAALNPELWDAFLADLASAVNSESAGIHVEKSGSPLAGAGIGAAAERQEGSSAHISALRSGRSGPYGPAEANLMRMLTPHLERAFALHSRMAELELHKAASSDALDRLPVGVFFLSENAKVVFLNRAAQAILDRNDGLRLLQSKLVAAVSAETRRIRKFILDASAVCDDVNLKRWPSQALSISRPSQRRPFFLTAMSLPRDGSPIRRQLAPNAPAVTILVNDPESEDRTGSDERIHGFGLSPAEGRVAYLLMQGKSTEDCAGEVGISIHTARTHVKRVLSKTGTKRQGELVHLLMKAVWQSSN